MDSRYQCWQEECRSSNLPEAHSLSRNGRKRLPNAKNRSVDSLCNEMKTRAPSDLAQNSPPSRSMCNTSLQAFLTVLLAFPSIIRLVCSLPFHLIPTIFPAPSPFKSITTKSSATLSPVHARWKCTFSLPLTSGPSENMNHWSVIFSGKKPVYKACTCEGGR